MRQKLYKVFLLSLVLVPLACTKDADPDIDTNLTAKVWTLKYF